METDAKLRRRSEIGDADTAAVAQTPGILAKHGLHVRDSTNGRRDVVAFFLVRVGRAALPLQLNPRRAIPRAGS